MTPRRLVSVLLALAIGGALFVVDGGDARAGTANWGTYYGTVTEVVDGDTLWVNVDGRGNEEIRFYGLDTMEWFACMGPEATARMTELAPVGTRVKLKGDWTLPPDAQGRATMRVFANGDDLAKIMLREGLAISRTSTELSNKVNRSYRLKSWRAQKEGLGIWNDQVCGKGPQQNADIRLRVNYEVDGPEEDDLAGEWVEIHNDGNSNLDLSGWVLREMSRSHLFEFPNGTTVPPGGFVTVVGGNGSGGGVFHWGNTFSILESRGDGVYLLDPGDQPYEGADIRAYVEFPCLFKCKDPLMGDVMLFVQYDADGKDKTNINGEWVDVYNISDSAIDLFDYVIQRDQHAYHFDESYVLPAGDSVRVHVGTGNDRARELYWGKDRPIFNNDAGEVILRSLHGVEVASYTWPCDPCGPAPPDIHIEFVNPDAVGVDGDNPNGEFIYIRNRTGSSVDLSGWSVASGGKQYFFDNGFTIGAGNRIKLFVGKGSDTGSKLYWGYTTGILNNDTDWVEVRNPFGVASDCYSWGGSICDRPDNPMPISISVDYQGHSPNEESFSFYNSGNSAIDMHRFKVVYKGHVYEFKNFTLGAKKTVTLFVGNGSDTNSSVYWGYNDVIITSQGIVYLYDDDGSKVKSKTWG